MINYINLAIGGDSQVFYSLIRNKGYLGNIMGNFIPASVGGGGGGGAAEEAPSGGDGGGKGKGGGGFPVWSAAVGGGPFVGGGTCLAI
jgi:hypothetical protein